MAGNRILHVFRLGIPELSVYDAGIVLKGQIQIRSPFLRDSLHAALDQKRLRQPVLFPKLSDFRHLLFPLHFIQYCVDIFRLITLGRTIAEHMIP